jgi:hypothetical protein
MFEAFNDDDINEDFPFDDQHADDKSGDDTPIKEDDGGSDEGAQTDPEEIVQESLSLMHNNRLLWNCVHSKSLRGCSTIAIKWCALQKQQGEK